MLVQSEKPLSVSGWRFPKSSSSKLVPVGILGLGDMGLVPGSGRAAHTLTVSCLEILRHPPRRLLCDQQEGSQKPRSSRKGQQVLFAGPGPEPPDSTRPPDHRRGFAHPTQTPPPRSSVTPGLTCLLSPGGKARNSRWGDKSLEARGSHSPREGQHRQPEPGLCSLNLDSSGKVLLSRRKGRIVHSFIHQASTLCHILR